MGDLWKWLGAVLLTTATAIVSAFAGRRKAGAETALSQAQAEARRMETSDALIQRMQEQLDKADKRIAQLEARDAEREVREQEMEARERAQKESLHELTLWCARAVEKGAAHVPPLILSPPPRSPLEYRPQET